MTLIEEHIVIPGDVFIQDELPNCDDQKEDAQIAKQFQVKFNERCTVRFW
jgi:hypothetical protein